MLVELSTLLDKHRFIINSLLGNIYLAIGLLVTLHFSCLLYKTNKLCKMTAWQGVTWRAITGMFGKGDYIHIYTLNQWFVLIFGISILDLIGHQYSKLFKKVKYFVSIGGQEYLEITFKY